MDCEVPVLEFHRQNGVGTSGRPHGTAVPFAGERSGGSLGSEQSSGEGCRERLDLEKDRGVLVFRRGR